MSESQLPFLQLNGCNYVLVLPSTLVEIGYTVSLIVKHFPLSGLNRSLCANAYRPLIESNPLAVQPLRRHLVEAVLLRNRDAFLRVPQTRGSSVSILRCLSQHNAKRCFLEYNCMP